MVIRLIPKVLPAVLLLALTASTVRAESFRLSPESDRLVVTGAAANGRVIFFGVSREVDPDDVVNVTPWAEVRTDEDGDRRVSFPLGRQVPLRSTWAAVDLATGDFDTAAPEGFRLKKVSFRGRGIGKRTDGRDSIIDARGLAEVLVVRPGVGAWTLRLGDGGPTDEDGSANGLLEVALDRMQPLGGSPPPPQSFQKDDVVLLIDPNLLEMTLLKVPVTPSTERPARGDPEPAASSESRRMDRRQCGF